MRKPWFRILILIIVWRFGLYLIEKLSIPIIPFRSGYLGPSVWSNFDGIHYLTIARSGYFQFGEAFFPLYPMLIGLISTVFGFVKPEQIGEILSLLCLVLAVIVWQKLERLDKKNSFNWTFMFLILFPTAFYLTSVYTESLFLLLSVTTFLLARKKQWLAAGLTASIASVTRITGILLLVPLLVEIWQSKSEKISFQQVVSLLLVPLGLCLYMYYQFVRTGDALVFFHVQPAFGANRSGSELILIPQVIWRYLKIIFTAFLAPTPVSYIVSVFEMIVTLGALYLLYLGWRMKIALSYLTYALLLVIVPTLTGTFSSMPRYVLTVFPLFTILGRLENMTVKTGLLIVFTCLQIVAAALFIHGYFIG